MKNLTPEQTLRTHVMCSSFNNWWAWDGLDWTGPYPSRLEAEIFLCDLWEF